MEQTRKHNPALRVSARIERAERSSVGRAGTLRQRAKFVTDIVVEDLSTSGCRITTDEEIEIGSVISIGIPGVGMQAARVMRSAGSVHGCAFLLPILEAEVRDALAIVKFEPVAFPTLREKVRSEAEAQHSRRSTDQKRSGLFNKIFFRTR